MAEKKSLRADLPLSAKAGIFVASATPVLIADVAQHWGVTGAVLGGLGAFALAKESPVLYEEMRKAFPFLPELTSSPRQPGERTLWDRLTNRYPDEQSCVAEAHPHEDKSEQLIIAQGNDEMEGQDPQNELIAPRKKRSGMFLFSEVLETFNPSLSKIYLGTLENGMLVFCQAEELCHVALAGATRGGKSSILRMLMAQLCYADAQVLLLNPHYSRYILDKKEDWTPFEPYLIADPMECRRYDVIEHYLRQVATELLPKRLDRFAHSQPVGKPYFLVIDELPAIVDHLPEAPQYLKAILREGAKVGLFLITAAQDFLVSTIFPGGGGAVRDCYRTVEYVGGDATTAKVLLDMPSRDVPENSLGKGRVMLRCDLVKPAALARVPLVDNEALYSLLGPSTYKANKQHLDEDDLVGYMMGTVSEQEAHTDALPAHTRRHVQTSAYDALRRRKAERKVPVYAVRAQERTTVPETPVRDEAIEISVQDAFAVWSAGNSNVRDLAKAMGITVYQATKLYGAMVEAGLIERKTKVTVRKD